MNTAALTFAYITRTPLTQDQVLNRAEDLIDSMEERFGRGAMDTQEAIDAVIDAAIEHAQG